MFYRSMTGKFFFPQLADYKKYFRFHSELPYLSYKWYPCVTPMWDNAARRKRNNFVAFTGSTPRLFGMWLKSVMEKFMPYSKEEKFIFINAWNEWAEGNHLEPDMKWGNRYLKEIQELLYNDKTETKGI